MCGLEDAGQCCQARWSATGARNAAICLRSLSAAACCGSLLAPTRLRSPPRAAIGTLEHAGHRTGSSRTLNGCPAERSCLWCHPSRRCQASHRQQHPCLAAGAPGAAPQLRRQPSGAPPVSRRRRSWRCRHRRRSPLRRRCRSRAAGCHDPGGSTGVAWGRVSWTLAPQAMPCLRRRRTGPAQPLFLCSSTTYQPPTSPSRSRL